MPARQARQTFAQLSCSEIGARFAGSGKSTFTTELELHIETAHRDRYDASGPRLILVKANLPALKNPLTDLFRETLARGYGLRDAQIDQLRDLAREGKVELLFLLDAYDELREEARAVPGCSPRPV